MPLAWPSTIIPVPGCPCILLFRETFNLEVLTRHSPPSLYSNKFVSQLVPRALLPHVTAARLKLEKKQAAFRAAGFLKIQTAAQPRAEHVTAKFVEWVQDKYREANNEVIEAQGQLVRLVHLSKEDLAINCREYSASKV